MIHRSLNFELGSALLTEISPDPFFIPESMGMKNYFDFDQSKIDWYRSLLSDLNFHDLLKVWQNDNHLILIDNYEFYRALQDHYSENPEVNVPILKIECSSKVKVKELSLRLKMLHSDDSHLSRCLNIKFLVECGCSYTEIKELYGVKKSSSAQARQVQRDYKLVKHPCLFNRVIGAPAGTENISAMLSPSPQKATLQYGMALQVLSILPDEQKFIEEFDQRYEEYIASLQNAFLYEDEITKPVFTWGKYSKEKVRTLAASVARGSDRLAFDYKYLIGDSALPDQKWSIKHSELTHEVSIPQIRLNLGVKADDNIKRIVDVIYKTEGLHYSLLSYIKRIHPAIHGSKIRVQSSEIAPHFETASNTPKFEDKAYFDFIRRHKLLYYCNRELLLKSIELKAHHFSFENYQYDAVSTYQNAHAKFIKWFDDEFLSAVSNHYNGRKTRHPKYSIYISIRCFLEKRAGDSASIFFGEFINQIFASVFTDMDTEQKHREEKSKVIMESDQKLRDAAWDQVQEASGKVSVDVSEVRSIARSLLQQDEDRLLSEIHKLNRAIQVLVTKTGADSNSQEQNATVDTESLRNLLT